MALLHGVWWMPCHKLRGKAESKWLSVIRGKMYLTVYFCVFVLFVFFTEKSRTVFTPRLCHLKVPIFAYIIYYIFGKISTTYDC